MSCTQTDWLTNEEYTLQFGRKVAENRIPVTGSIDLTNRCDFRCVHCYISYKNRGNDRQELSTDQWKSVIDEIAERGCLFLLMTGGDPFVRPDFCEIYQHARSRGLIVTIFTNGYFLPDEIVQTLQEYPPRLVEITLYGATDKTYKKITGKKDGFEKCLATVNKLHSHGINVGLKTVLMTLNYDEFHEIEEIAASLDMNFRYDPAIFPRFNGDRAPLSLRVAPEKVAALDFEDKDRARAWKKLHDRYKEFVMAEKLYNCGSGQTTFHVTAEGWLQPCIMAADIHSDLRLKSFSKGWFEDLPVIRDKTPSEKNICWNCTRNTLCNYCPPFSAIEKGDENSYSEYLCSLSRLRLEEITQIS